MSDDAIRVDRNEHVAEVVLTGPTMKPAFFDQLGETFAALSAENDLRAVIIRSEAKPFTYGLDLPAAFASFGQQFSGTSATSRAELQRTIRRLQASISAVADCPVPVIAAVHGYCLGGGVDLITACDLRLASADATFSVRETRIAIVADIGTLQRLPRIVGPGHARELAFTGMDINASRAAEIGLVNRVLPSREALDTAARELAQSIAKNAPLTVRGVKRVMDYGADRSVEDGLEYVAAWNSAFLATEDLGEAITSFMEKREPIYKGK